MIEVARRPLRRRRLGAGLVVLASLAVACDGGSGDDDTVAAAGEAYAAVLATVLPATGIGADDDGPLPVLYLWEFGEVPMSLDDQVVVIDHFDDAWDVRFVDNFDAAVDVDEPSVPPRDEGFLIGLGPIPVEPPHTVRVELYANADDTSALLVTLDSIDETWTVTGDEPVDPEAFDVVA